MAVPGRKNVENLNCQTKCNTDVAFTSTNSKVAFTSANVFCPAAATIREALEAESEADLQAIRRAVRLDCTYPHGKLSSLRGRGMGLGPCSSSSAYLCIHADKCFVKATVVREAIMFMLTTNGVGAPFVGRDKYERFSYDHAGIALPYLL